jgi:hypothetical protein
MNIKVEFEEFEEEVEKDNIFNVVIKEKNKGVDKQLEAIELGAIYDKEEIQDEEMTKTNKEMKLIEELMNGKDGEPMVVRKEEDEFIVTTTDDEDFVVVMKDGKKVEGVEKEIALKAIEVESGQEDIARVNSYNHEGCYIMEKHKHDPREKFHKDDGHEHMETTFVEMEKNGEVSIVVAGGKYDEKETLSLGNEIVEATRDKKEENTEETFGLCDHLIICVCVGINNNIEAIKVKK